MTAEQTLRLFVKGLSKRKGIEKNLWVEKFIKRIIYSKEEILISLYYKRSFDEEDSACLASGRVGAAAGRKAVSLAGKKITPISTDRGNHQDWLPGQDSNLRLTGYSLSQYFYQDWTILSSCFLGRRALLGLIG